jgi:LysR family transcriptional regulator for metE and metH
MIERSHLEILRALGEEGTLKAVARRLCLTQPAVTHQIQKLERRAGAALWEREGRGVRLTQAGAFLAAVGAQMLPTLERAEASLQSFADGKKGLLRIGVECYPCFEWLLDIIRRYLKRVPEVDVDVVQRFQFTGHEALKNRQIDLLITADPQAKGTLHYEPLFDYELLLAVPKRHAFAKRRSLVPEDFRDQVVLTYPVEPDRLDLFTKFLNPAGISPAKRMPIEATEVMLQMVSAGRGVCSLPDWIVGKHKRSLGLAGVRLGKQGILKRLYAAVRNGEQSIGYTREFFAVSRGT